MKKPSSKTLKEKLDRVFSEYIRKRDTVNGVCKCISCGSLKDYSEIDCGHYVNRRHFGLRWDEKNCNGQCVSCNRFDEGNVLGYTRGLMSKYGPDVIDYLASKKHNIFKPNVVIYQALIDEYKDKIKRLPGHVVTREGMVKAIENIMNHEVLL